MGGERRGSGAALVGLALVVVGIGFLLRNLGVVPFDLSDLITKGWPAILIALGAKHLYERRVTSGVVFLAIGVVFQLIVLDLLDSGVVADWWPLLLIGLGAWMVTRTTRPRPDAGAEGGGAVRDPGDTFRVFQMWGGTRRVLTSKSFRGGEATAVMGGIEVDLRQAALAPGGARVDVTALMGGVELKVPPDWEVIVSGSPLMGAVEDKRGPVVPRPDGEPGPRLAVRATVLMGGLEVS